MTAELRERIRETLWREWWDMVPAARAAAADQIFEGFMRLSMADHRAAHDEAYQAGLRQGYAFAVARLRDGTDITGPKADTYPVMLTSVPGDDEPVH